jgi:16S rRNA (guanine527-N7)-methyltransferase
MMEDPASRLPPEGVRALEAYRRLLEDEGIRLGLIARGDAARIWERHVLDSLRALGCLRPSDRAVADLGSGGGLPGIPVAIARPELRVVLIEARPRRAAFLEMAVERLRLANAQVVAGAAPSVPEAFDTVLARAFGPLDRAWAVAAPLLSLGGALVYFAGRSWSVSSMDVQALVASGADPRICGPAEFPWQGPLVIMSRVRRDTRQRS